LPDEYQRERIVRLRGQRLHQTSPSLVMQPEMQQDQALPDSRSVTTGIDVQRFLERAKRRAFLNFWAGVQSSLPRAQCASAL